MTVQIGKGDVHLVGEFVEVLRAFGVSDDDPQLQGAMRFLLDVQAKPQL